MATRLKPSTKTASGTQRQLARYRAKRDFHISPEPSGATSKSEPRNGKKGLAFVIQKHAASHLHYDFRLEWNGVLKSWAVAKGPSYDPADKRLAVEVEDHPLDYGGFEGIIPKGQYGGGTVMLWDRGTWEPLGDAAEGLREGKLKFVLHGEKLRGHWTLVRMAGRPANKSKPNWLLIKEHDEEERSGSDAPIVEEAPDSVLSGRDLDEIAQAKDSVWNSKEVSSGRRSTSNLEKSQAAAPQPELPKLDFVQSSSKRLRSTPKESLPSFISPQLASLTETAPHSDDWVHELKLDGYRIQARLQSKAKPRVQLLTRGALDWTHRMNSIAEALAVLPVRSALLDGEVVVLTSDGNTSFANLQAAFQESARYPLTYFVFDLLHLDGHNLRDLPLVERKDILHELLSSLLPHEQIRISEHISGDGRTVFDKACKLGAEGIISKLAQGKYTSGRSKGWLKLKCYQEQEFVISGFTLPSNGTHGIGSLLLGYYKGGKLVYAGRTGTGFTRQTHRIMRERLEGIQNPKPPFASLPAGAGRGVRWVNPELVAQVSFATWTADNLVRQAAFKGLREDKPAKAVRREEELQVPPEQEVRKESARPARRTSAGRTSKASHADEPLAQLPIRLTHPDKVLDASSGLTKEHLAQYYAAVASHMLPHIAGRPLSLVRCLDGTGKPCFFQKHANETLPRDIESVDIVDKKTGKPEPYITLSTPEALMELAQLNALEVHAWGSRNDSIEKPDRIVIDLDPDAAIDWKTLTAAAKEVRERLKSAGLQSFLKTTGGKGLHIVAPIRPEHTWPDVKNFAHQLALAMEADNPSLYLTRMTKAARKGKIFIDYLRNERGATSIAPFSPRAREGATVALPLHWSDLESAERPVFAVLDFPQWKERLTDDPWKRMLAMDQHLTI